MRTSARFGMVAVVNAAAALGAAEAAHAPIAPGLWWQMVALLVVGTLGQAVFAGLETGLYTVNRVRLRVRSSRKDPPDLAARILAGEVAVLPVVLPALLIGYILTGAMASYGLTVLLTAQGLGSTALLLVNLLAVTPLMFILADMLPKELFRADADRLMYRAAPLLKGWRLLLTYTGVLPTVQWLAHGLARVLVRRASAPDGGGGDGVGGGGGGGGGLEQTRAHIHALLQEGAGGVMSESQLTLVDRAFGLRESDVSDEMIPWSRCRIIQRSWTRDAVLAFVRKHPYSRFPVADGPRLLGVVEFVDICLAGEGEPLERLVRPAVRLAAGVPVRDAMKTLMGEGERMGVVVENGRPIGLVTMKDLVEPLTGELRVW